MVNDSPIGLLDSGVGGLTVAKDVIRQLPNEKIIYVGDNARCPYGTRSQEEVLQFTWEMVQFLLRHGVKMIIIACNTATVAAFEVIRTRINIPIIGVVDFGARAAIRATQNLSIGVIATAATITSRAYEQALLRMESNAKVTSVACQQLVSVVESGDLDSRATKKIVTESLMPLKGIDIDTLVLGCTHYPLLSNVIAEVLGDKVKIISSGEETASEASAILQQEQLLRTGVLQEAHEFYTTGSAKLFKQIAGDLLGVSVQGVNQIKL